jgi:predicted dehydrogenase
MKTLLVGFGSIGRRHLRNLRALGENDVVVLRSHRSTLPDDEIAGLPIVQTMEEALAFKPQAAVIANPTALHLDAAIPLAKAGCHLLMEKPVSHSLERIDELSEALREGGGQVLVGFQFRFHPGLRQVKQWLESDEIGQPVSFRSHWAEYLPDWHPWEDYHTGYAARKDLGGGVILTLTHPLDYLRWLLGDVAALWSFASTLGDLGIEVVDSAEIGLMFQRGVNGSLHLDYLQRPPSHTLEITGTRGMIRWDNASGNASLYRVSSGTWEEWRVPEGFERNWLFMEELRHFIQVVQGSAAPICTLDDGAWALRLALAAHQSAECGILIKF